MPGRRRVKRWTSSTAPLVHAVGDAAGAVAEVLGVEAEVAGPLGVVVRQRPQAPGQLVDRSGVVAGVV